MAAADKAKFKVGDRVRVTANEDVECEGKTAVVVWVCSPDWVHVRFEQPIDGWGEDGQEWGVGAEKLELLPVAEATSTLKYGDIVRCIEDYDGQFTAGKEYIVRSVYRNGEIARIAVVEDDLGSKTNGWLASKFVPAQRVPDEPAKTWLEKEIESGRMSVSEARAHIGLDPAPTDTAGYTVPLCAYEESEAVGVSLHIGDGSSWVQIAGNQPAIVCLIENGQPLPSSRPHVHRNKGAASKEAERLAKKYPGQRFGVYEYVSHAEAAKPTYKHEWQQLAVDGQKIAAIKEVRSITGLGLRAAKDAVEHWLAYDEPYSRVAAA